MRYAFKVMFAGAMLAASAIPAQAGIYSDDMAKCLVAHATPEDQTNLILWVFAAMARHPAVQPYANITEAQHTAIDAMAGQLFQRLVTVDCRKETVAALKNEGPGVFESSFQVFGEVAMRGIMSNPAVAGEMGGLAKGVDNQKIKDVFTEAGVPQAGN